MFLDSYESIWCLSSVVRCLRSVFIYSCPRKYSGFAQRKSHTCKIICNGDSNLNHLQTRVQPKIRYRLQAVTIAKILLFAGAYFYIPTESCLGLPFTEAFGLAVPLPSLLWSLMTTVALMSVFYLGNDKWLFPL